MKTMPVAFFLFAFSIATAMAQPAGMSNDDRPSFLPVRSDPLFDGPFDLPAPGQKADFNKILTQASVLTQKGLYQGALQHLVWYYTNSETDPSQKGVRVSFAINYWIELSRSYPKATQALVEIRNSYEQRLLDGHGSPGLFQDVNAMNQSLGSEDDTCALFKSIEHDPKLAANCYEFIEDELVQRGEYETCRKYIGDPDLEFQKIHQRYEMGLQGVQQHLEMRQRFDQKQKEQQQADDLFRQQIQTKYSIHASAPPPPPPPLMPDDSGILKKSAEHQFISQVRALVEILVATGDKADAEDIQKQALAVLDDPRLETAVDDVYEKFAQQTNPGGTSQTILPVPQN